MERHRIRIVVNNHQRIEVENNQKAGTMNHKNLDAWKSSMDFVTEAYSITRKFPEEEKFGMISQIRRAAVSVPVNISEGAARNHDKELIQFLYISLGSLSELETLLLIALNLNFIDSTINDDLQMKLETIKKPVSGLIKYLKNKR